MIEALDTTTPDTLAPVRAWLAEEGGGDALVLVASRFEREAAMRVLGAKIAGMPRHVFRQGDRCVRFAAPEDGAESIQGQRFGRVWATDTFLSHPSRPAREMWREAWWRVGKGPPPVTCAIGEGAG